MLDNLVISLIAGTRTFTFLAIFGVPYALLLSIFVAILDLASVIGSTKARTGTRVRCRGRSRRIGLSIVAHQGAPGGSARSAFSWTRWWLQSSSSF